MWGCSVLGLQWQTLCPWVFCTRSAVANGKQKAVSQSVFWMISKGKGKGCTLNISRSWGEAEVYLGPYPTLSLERVGGRHAPAALPQVPIYRRLVSGGRSGWMRKFSLPQRFEPRTVQPLTSPYTDWAIPATYFIQHPSTKHKCQYSVPFTSRSEATCGAKSVRFLQNEKYREICT
jgi:hypothetical protein